MATFVKCVVMPIALFAYAQAEDEERDRRNAADRAADVRWHQQFDERIESLDQRDPESREPVADRRF